MSYPPLGIVTLIPLLLWILPYNTANKKINNNQWGFNFFLANSSIFNFFVCSLFFYFYFFLLYNTVLVLQYIDMNLPRVYMSSQSWTPLPPPSPYHLSGSSQCTSPKHPVFCIETRLAIFSYMIVYIFQCHSPKSSQQLPLPLSHPQSPKVCSIHLCLFCCLAHRVIITIILNSIYMC